MKKYILIGLALAFVAGSVSAARSAGMYYTQSTNGTLASTTASFVIGGFSTTTQAVISDGYEQVSWLVALASSSTAPTLCWKNQYSNNGTDWYTEDYSYASSTIHISAEKQECWAYSTTTDGTTIISRGVNGLTNFIGRKIVVPKLDSVYTRTVFTLTPGVKAMLDIRSNLKNEVILAK